MFAGRVFETPVLARGKKKFECEMAKSKNKLTLTCKKIVILENFKLVFVPFKAHVTHNIFAQNIELKR